MFTRQRNPFTYVLGIVKRHGPPKVKARLWDREFVSSKWDFIDDTSGDYVYPHLEKYAAAGNILDLGCGPGNTANELASTAYGKYIGVDISEAALRKAVKRTEASGRSGKNEFVQGDFLSYKPTLLFDVILFRESMYHVPVNKVKTILDYYSPYLKDTGVFIVRMVASGAKGRPTAALHIMETEFDVIEKHQYGEDAPTVIIFRPHFVSTVASATRKARV